MHAQTLGFGILTAQGIWALILLNPRPLDGAVPDGEYGTFFDHYGEDLEDLVPGHVLQKETGELLLIYDKKNYFQMYTGEIPEGQRTVQCFLYAYPSKHDKWRGKRMMKMKPVVNQEITFMLVNRFLWRYLPFDPVYCNRHNYMKYILYGEVTRNEKYFKACPLAAPLGGVDAYQLQWQIFKLKDSFGKEHDFTEYDTPKKYSRAESLIRGARTEPSYQGARSESSYQGARPESSYQGARSESSYHGARRESSYQGARSESSYHGARPESSYQGARSESSYHGSRAESPYQGARPESSYQGARSESSKQMGKSNSESRRARSFRSMMSKAVRALTKQKSRPG